MRGKEEKRSTVAVEGEEIGLVVGGRIDRLAALPLAIGEDLGVELVVDLD